MQHPAICPRCRRTNRTVDLTNDAAIYRCPCGLTWVMDGGPASGNCPICGSDQAVRDWGASLTAEAPVLAPDMCPDCVTEAPRYLLEQRAIYEQSELAKRMIADPALALAGKLRCPFCKADVPVDAVTPTTLCGTPATIFDLRLHFCGPVNGTTRMVRTSADGKLVETTSYRDANHNPPFPVPPRIEAPCCDSFVFTSQHSLDCPTRRPEDRAMAAYGQRLLELDSASVRDVGRGIFATKYEAEAARMLTERYPVSVIGQRLRELDMAKHLLRNCVRYMDLLPEADRPDRAWLKPIREFLR